MGGGDSFQFDRELPVASADASTEPLLSSLEQEQSLSLVKAGALPKLEFLGDNFHIAGLSDGDDVRERTVETLKRLNLPPETTQMVVVTAPQWDATMGTLSLYERKAGENEYWQFTGEAWPVDLGHKGMGWGRGLIDSVDNRASAAAGKREGDQKAPAGVFSFGSAFGYDKNAPDGVKMKYLQAGERDFFVDDPNSPDYNSWVRLSEKEKPGDHWQSFEKMKRDDQRYKLGLVVEHNMNPAIPGDGSAIFLHVWKEPGSGTAGCTSMSEENMRELLRWLDPGKKPLLMQIPTQAMSEL
jgi:D-alanyl-D-alanine dipeptidase